MFKGTQEDSFFQSLTPQQKQQYLQLQQQKAAQASLQAQQMIEQRITQNVETALQQESKQQQQQQQPPQLQIITYNPSGITTNTTHPLTSSFVQVNVPFTQLQVQPPPSQPSQPSLDPLLELGPGQQQQKQQQQRQHSLFSSKFPALYKSKLSQAPWRNMIATRYSKQPIKSGDVPPTVDLLGLNAQRPNPQQPILDLTPQGLNEYLSGVIPHGNVSFLHGEGIPAQYITPQPPQQPPQQRQRHPHQHPAEGHYFDPLELLFGGALDDGFDMEDEFINGPLHGRNQQQQRRHHPMDPFGMMGGHPMMMGMRDPFFGPMMGGSGHIDPFEMMMGGRHGDMMKERFGMGMDELSQQAQATQDPSRRFGGSSVMTYSSSSSSSSDGVIRKTSSFNSNNNFDGTPKTKSFSNSSVTRVGPDGIARTEKSHEEMADDGTLDGKKHKKVVTTEVKDDPALFGGFGRRRNHRRSNQKEEMVVEPEEVIPAAEIQRIETDFIGGDTKIIHERRLGDKQHQHVTAISIPAPGAETFAQYDEVEGMNHDELNQFNAQFAKVAPKLTAQPPQQLEAEEQQQPPQQQEFQPIEEKAKNTWKLW